MGIPVGLLFSVRGDIVSASTTIMTTSIATAFNRSRVDLINISFTSYLHVCLHHEAVRYHAEERYETLHKVILACTNVFAPKRNATSSDAQRQSFSTVTSQSLC